MAPKKGRVRRLPRNTVTLVIDGTEEEVLKNFRACQAYFRYWNFCTGAFRVRIGNRVIYTTPLRGTFYYVVRYRGRNLVFVIVARQYWLIGFFGENGFYQMLFEGQRTIYMNSTKGTTVIPLSANHSVISHKGVENTRLNIHAVRGGFDSIHSYRGPRHALPEGFPAAIGRFTVLIMETKFKDIHNRCEEALVGYENTRLGEVLKDLVINWSTLCKIVMNAIMKRYHMAEELAEIRSLLSQILIYQVDAVRTGLFAHEPLPPEPRTEVWEPIDEEYIDGGMADSEVPNFDTPPPPAAPRHIAKRGVKRGFSQINQPGEKNARKGLRGGGAGEVLRNLEISRLENEDKNECDMLVVGARELGLLIVEVDPLLVSKNKENQSDQGGKVTKNISNSDVADLRNNNFLSDNVISNYFRQLSAMLDSDEVLLVDAASAVAYAQDPTSINPEHLRNRRIVVLPVNNTTEFGRPDRGSHWSVLIIDATSEGSPRFIHHDSSDGLNLPAAQQLAARMRTIFPAAQEVEDVQTPRQQNGHDCAVYVMAIANSITSWWTRREFEENWMDRMWNEVTAEKVRTMRQKLAELLENEELEKETKKVASDVADLRNNSFLSDNVISNYFSQLSAMSGSDEVLLVDAASAVAYAQDPTSINPEHLRNRRIVVLPVNNTTEFGRPDRGSHWSVLIIDATSEGSPRFIHHDSSDGLNLPAAQQLAARMRTIFPAAQEVEDVQTPRQQNGHDCAVYVMAIANSITSWWTRREFEENWMDRMWNEVTAEKVRTMRQKLAELLENEELEKETKKVASDVADLRNNSFLSDNVISNYFSQLSAMSGSDEVLLVDAASAVAYAQDPTSINPEHLRNRRIVVLPVNNTTEFGRPDRGSHWSVLIIDATSEGSPRFIHHDSSDGLNLPAAQQLAARMRTIFPAAQEVEDVQTPRQQNGHDCAVYVMAIANSITSWWTRREFEENWMDRMWNEVTAEKVRTMRQKLAELLENEELEKETKKVASDVADLRNNSFLSDNVISNYFSQLSAMSGSDEVLLVDAASAVAYAQDPTSINPEHLRNRRIVVLPVNNTTEFGRPDRGSHWSVLIIDATSEGSPRFIHHDSSDGLNLPAAQQLAARMRTIFPAAQEVEDVQTPRQQNGHDCAVYVMAIANSITSWWTRREFEENWMDRMWNEVTAEKVRTMRQKLAELLENEELEKETKKVASDVADLRNNSFLSDNVISNYFSQLSAMSGSDEVLLVDAASAVAYAQDPTSINPEHLRNRRIVVLPVNNTTEFGRPDRGSHWSVLIIDATSEGSPRFIHHDSSDGLNLPAAQQLAARMRTIFPAAQEVEDVQTPRQQNGHDCAVYVMAIANSITSWWTRREFEENWMDRMWNEVTAEKVRTMRQKLAELLENEELEKETKKVASDVADLRNNSFLSDNVISNYFSQLSAMSGSDEVLLVDAASAVAYAQDPTSINPEHLRNRRIVVLPVNNTTEFGRPDRGSHWSVLIIDATSEGSPRFIHHDSSDGLNLLAAQQLAERMRAIFPAAQEVENVQTPRQQNGYDCAVYVMAIARSITKWWARRASEKDWMDIMCNEVTAEKVCTMRQQLADFLEKEELEKETKKAECKKEKTKEDS